MSIKKVYQFYIAYRKVNTNLQIMFTIVDANIIKSVYQYNSNYK